MRAYKAKFEYLGFEISVKAKYYAGRAATYEDPAEDPEFDLVSLAIDGTDCMDLSPEFIASEIFEIDDYEEFWRACCEQIYLQNEHIIKPDYRD